MAKFSDFSKNPSLAPSNTTSAYITPPVKKEDNKLTITGLVEGVKLKSYEVSDGNYGRQVTFHFENEAGQTTRKFVNEIDASATEDSVRAQLETMYNLHLYFFENTAAKAVDAKGEEIDFTSIEQIVDVLFGNEDFTTSKTGTIKMVFAKPFKGQYPKYSVAKYNWFGDGIYFSKKEKDGELSFTIEVPSEGESTFSSGGAEIKPEVTGNSLF